MIITAVQQCNARRKTNGLSNIALQLMPRERGAPCSSKEMSDAGGVSAVWVAGRAAVSSQEGGARKGLLCLRRAAGGPMLEAALGVWGLPDARCFGGGGGGMERSCSFTSDFSA